MASLRSKLHEQQAAAKAAYRSQLQSRLGVAIDSQGKTDRPGDMPPIEQESNKRPRLLELVSVYESLPFENFAEIMLEGPVINASALAVNKLMAEKIQQAANTPDFFKTMVQRCFPLITRLPDDMIGPGPVGYEAVANTHGTVAANNWTWRLLFLRIFEALLSMRIDDSDTGSSSVNAFKQNIRESKIVTCADVLKFRWTFWGEDVPYTPDGENVDVYVDLASEMRQYAANVQFTADIFSYPIIGVSDTPTLLFNGTGQDVLRAGAAFRGKPLPQSVISKAPNYIKRDLRHALTWKKQGFVEVYARRIDDAALADMFTVTFDMNSRYQKPDSYKLQNVVVQSHE